MVSARDLPLLEEACALLLEFPDAEHSPIGFDFEVLG
jgi:hypothetical protein